jgi:Fur family ferric uptake transcriptional regulator
MHHLTEVLCNLGYRPTPQRLITLSALEDGEGQLTAEEIHNRVSARYPYADISTIYRNLKLLRNLGLVTQTGLGGGCVQYRLAEKGHHHHLVCRKCGGRLEWAEPLLGPLKEALLKGYGFQADLSHLAILGLCQA